MCIRDRFTAVGPIRPANVLVIGVGVAGLQALATARRLGAVTYAADIRPAAAEQAKSLGAKVVDKMCIRDSPIICPSSVISVKWFNENK